MNKQMCWRLIGNQNVLYLTYNGRWIPYHQSALKQPDHNIPGASKGFATLQWLIKRGWTVIPDPNKQPEPPDTQTVGEILREMGCTDISL